MIRVVVAEDSPTVSQLLVGILESDPEVTIVGHATNGVEAVDLVTRLRPDLVTMDVNMPLMDGLEATKEIMVTAPTPILIVSGAASAREVDLSLNATRAGALFVVRKPTDPSAPDFDGLSADLVRMVKAMAQVKVVRRWARGTAAAPRRPPVVPGAAQVRLVTIAASTGGPAALQRILGALPGDFGAPILVVQHIAEGFVRGLADWLAGSTPLRVKVAEHGEPVVKRTVFLAPDGRHLGVSRQGRIVIDSGPPVSGFRPSGTFLFQAAAEAYGPSGVSVILTGMGCDGVAGLRVVKAAGGRVLAQDQGTSVVYGMPREAAVAGVVDGVLALEEVATTLTDLVGGRR